MNILRFLPFLALAALALSAPAPAMAQNDPMGAGSFSGGNGSDIETLANTELMETSQDSEDDLKDQMRRVKERNEKKKAQREALQKMKDERGKLRETAGKSNQPLKTAKTPVLIKAPPKKNPPGTGDSLSDTGEHQQEKMKAVQDRMEKADTAASRVMEKYSDTQGNIVGNTK